jgi:hypothetical protein
MMRRAIGFLVAASVFGALAHALNIAFGMTWEILWALVLGFARRRPCRRSCRSRR